MGLGVGLVGNWVWGAHSGWNTSYVRRLLSMHCLSGRDSEFPHLNPFTPMSLETEDSAKIDVDQADEFRDLFDQLESDLRPSAEKVIDYLSLLKNDRYDDAAVRLKEQCIYRIAKINAEANRLQDILGLLKQNGDFFTAIPKAKTAKIVRNILSIVAESSNNLEVQSKLCADVIEWCKAEKRTFLRQRVEAKLAQILVQMKEPTKALVIVDELLRELKKLDDKQMLTEVHLTESRVYHSLQNIPKAKASLTASRTAANAIYVSPLLQAEIDEMSGSLHCEEQDYNTAFSYFLEAFDAYDQGNQRSAAMTCLKYMILCKVLNKCAQEVPSLIASKLAAKYTGSVDVEALSSIARAAKAHSLENFRQTMSSYGELLRSDDLVAHNLDILYDNMLEANLLKIIHPYRAVEISHVAVLVKLPEKEVISKLSQMILDQKFFGILEQGKGHLIIYDSSTEDKCFTKAVEIIGSISSAVGTLHSRAKNLSVVN